MSIKYYFENILNTFSYILFYLLKSPFFIKLFLISTTLLQIYDINNINFIYIVIYSLFVYELALYLSYKYYKYKYNINTYYYIPLLGILKHNDKKTNYNFSSSFLLFQNVFCFISLLPFLYLYYTTLQESYLLITYILSLIYLLNLLPIYPLDGGKLLYKISYSINYQFGNTIFFLSTILSFFLIFYYHFYLLFIIQIIGFIQIYEEKYFNIKYKNKIIFLENKMYFWLLYVIFFAIFTFIIYKTKDFSYLITFFQ